MAPETFQTLLSGYHAGTLSVLERQELMAVLHDPVHRELLESLFPLTLSVSDSEVADLSRDTLKMVYEQIKLLPDHANENKINKPFRIGRWAAAATILITLAAGTYYLSGRYDHLKVPDDSADALQKAEHILPGSNKAMLTLANGTNIVLDNTTKGEIARQSGVTITKTADGHLSYALTAKRTPASIKGDYNTITTPKGGQYQLALPDGTMVWLNAASSLGYPAVFNGQERRVELKGEAYFEVAKNKQQPFYVKTQKQEIEVLGTHFNLNAYADERSVKTTLIEGSVKVKLNTGATAVLKPGQQSAVQDDIRITAVDASSAMDWKQGVFWFNDESIESIMRQFSRWYGIEVEYRGEVGHICFGGQVSRMKNLSQVLRIMALTKSVRFKMEGKKLIVMPQPDSGIYPDRSVKAD